MTNDVIAIKTTVNEGLNQQNMFVLANMMDENELYVPFYSTNGSMCAHGFVKNSVLAEKFQNNTAEVVAVVGFLLSNNENTFFTMPNETTVSLVMQTKTTTLKNQ